ncbi:MAG: IS1634 family transposase [Deltaproteobacteria bacterium]|jgi:transposase|nr:IS1634 family transposase [Deltaproteobacteria bacterium]
MSFLIKRKSGTKTYWYLAKSVKVDGVWKQKILKCLGTSTDIATKYENSSVPDTKTNDSKFHKSTVYQFASVTALMDIAKRLDIEAIIDKHVPKRNQGLTIGSYMLLAAINRVVEPTGKNSFYDWFKTTMLGDTYLKADENSLSSQSFWNHMVELNQDTISAIEDDITKSIVEKYRLSTDYLLYNTNFFTYIDTSNPATVPQRGQGKKKPTDPEIIGLSMIATPEHNIPLFHEVYPENNCDAKQFTDVIDRLKKRAALISDDNSNITLVFDKGNNSACIVDILEDNNIYKLYFVGSLRFNQCPDILTINRKSYTPLEGDTFGGISVVRLQHYIYGRNLTILITDDPKLRKSQLIGVRKNVAKCQKSLEDLQYRLIQRNKGIIVKGKKPTLDSVIQNVQKILSSDYMKQIVDYDIEILNGNIGLTFSINKIKYKKIQQKYLGKTILFTNRDNWSNEQIVAAYRSQFHVESAFKQIKSTKYLSFKPVRHFTDKTITVHPFYCILGYTLSCLLQREMEELGFKMTINNIIKELKEKMLTITIVPSTSSHALSMTHGMTTSSEAIEKYVKKYDLLKYVKR